MAATKTVENHLKTGGEEREFASRVSGTHEISPLCREVFEELKIRRKHRYILFRIGDEEIEVESTGTRDQVVICVYQYSFMIINLLFLSTLHSEFRKLKTDSPIY